MQAELSDKISEKQGLRQVACTALIVALVCVAMPFLHIISGEYSVTYHLWAFATSDFQYSDIGFLFPAEVTSMLIVVRVFAWAVIIFAALGLIMVFNPNRSDKGNDSSLWVMIFSLLAVAFLFGLYFFVMFLVRSYADASAVFGFENGALAMVAGFCVTSLAMLVKKVNDRTKLATLLIFIAIPLTVIFGTMLLDNREFYFISLLVIFETMLPFFLIFENRKPEARELVVIAVVAAIGVVGRAIFFMLPNFKPVTAIVIIAGATLGPEAGFLTGAMTAFVSNFFFGQGPWTPWQMFSFGIIGFLTGILFRKKILRKDKKLRLCIYGAFVSLCIFGLLMDTYTVFTMDFVSSWPEVLAVYASGFPVNCVHAVGTFLFLSVLAKPMIEKIERVRTKYGMLDPNEVKKEKRDE